MNTALWIVQGMLGGMMLILGVMKSFLPVEKLNKFSWTTRNSKNFTRFVGISELMIGFGLVLATHRHPAFTYFCRCSFFMPDYDTCHCRTYTAQ